MSKQPPPTASVSRLADWQLEEVTPKEGTYQYNTFQSAPFYNNFFKVPIFAQAYKSGCFKHDPSVTVLISPVGLLPNGSLRWTDTSSLGVNPQRRWQYSFELAGLRDDTKPEIIYNAVYVFSTIYNFMIHMPTEDAFPPAKVLRSKKFATLVAKYRPTNASETNFSSDEAYDSIAMSVYADPDELDYPENVLRVGRNKIPSRERFAKERASAKEMFNRPNLIRVPDSVPNSASSLFGPVDDTNFNTAPPSPTPQQKIDWNMYKPPSEQPQAILPPDTRKTKFGSTRDGNATQQAITATQQQQQQALTASQTQLQLAFQLIDNLTKRVTEVEAHANQLAQIIVELSQRADIIPVKHDEPLSRNEDGPFVPVKQKPNSRQKRNKNLSTDNSSNLRNPNNPNYTVDRNKLLANPTAAGFISNRDKYDYSKKPITPKFLAPRDYDWNLRNAYVRNRDADRALKGLHPIPAWENDHRPTNTKDIHNGRDQKQTKKLPATPIYRDIKKPKPEKYLNPNYKETPKAESKKFFENKINSLNQALKQITLKENGKLLSKVEDKFEPLYVFNPTTQKKEFKKNTSPYERAQRKRNAIKQSRLKAYKSLECLGYTHYSHRARVNKNHEALVRTHDKSVPPPLSSNALPFSPNPYLYNPYNQGFINPMLLHNQQFAL